ncbi:hypothetical protein [Streptomyces sp. 1331.2]|uniref:hypothetical protein n=1 Tax=Streptomyces sp. 1331.2 TaxID=1938835 RepID=UPI000BD7CB64|nr:hypothetical protein [Streptomyces sp. 1331.2]SOB83101.1 hypothetical protein SAMN06272789_3299 [Streptomyces sp. 1331.2]
MADTVHSLVARVHELLVAQLTHGGAAVVPGIHDVIARATALGPDGTWLAAAGHSTLAGLALAHGRPEEVIHHLDAAVTAGYNDCVALHMPALQPLHHDPRFRALYQRMRITLADLDELLWLHQEMQTMVREAQNATVDNIGRLDTGVSLLPRAPLPTREPHTPGVLITRIDLSAAHTALQQAAVKAEFQRSAGNTSLSLIDDTWDQPRAMRDAWHADDLDTRRQQAAEARAFVERPGAGSMLVPCPPLGSIRYPA